MQFFQILLTWISQTTKLDGIIVGSSECVFTMTNSCAILEFFFLCNIFIGLCMEVCMLNSMHTMLLLSGLVSSVTSSPLYHLQSIHVPTYKRTYAMALVSISKVTFESVPFCKRLLIFQIFIKTKTWTIPNLVQHR